MKQFTSEGETPQTHHGLFTRLSRCHFFFYFFFSTVKMGLVCLTVTHWQLLRSASVCVFLRFPNKLSRYSQEKKETLLCRSTRFDQLSNVTCSDCTSVTCGRGEAASTSRLPLLAVTCHVLLASKFCQEKHMLIKILTAVSALFCPPRGASRDVEKKKVLCLHITSGLLKHFDQ